MPLSRHRPLAGYPHKSIVVIEMEPWLLFSLVKYFDGPYGLVVSSAIAPTPQWMCPYRAHAYPVQGPLEPVYKAALALGTANQLTNILRDVGEDVSERNRIYVPTDDLAQFGITEDEVCLILPSFLSTALPPL